MTDAITCPDCGVNADTCRCPRPVAPWPHTSAMLYEADQPTDAARASLIATPGGYRQVTPGLVWEERWRKQRPFRPYAFTVDAAGRLTLRTEARP